MSNIVVVGGFGRMGKSICSLLDSIDNLNLVAIVDRVNNENIKGVEFKTDLKSVNSSYDIVVDFTPVDSMMENLKLVSILGKKFISGTTGLSSDQIGEMKKLSSKTSIFYSTNFSTGIYILNKLVDLTTKMADESFDIEVVEMHHNGKTDAPSGTAKTILNTIHSARKDLFEKHGRFGNNAKRLKNEIGVHTLRGGDVIGDHKVIFSGVGENIEISHRAVTRDLFSKGVIKAIRFIENIDKFGLYGMDDLFLGSLD